MRTVRQVVTYERWDNIEVSALEKIKSIDSEFTIVLGMKRSQDWYKVL